MKRVLSVTLCFLALAALFAVPAYSGACGGETAKTADASQVSAKGQCNAQGAAACSAKLGIPPEECQKLCATGEYTMIDMSIKGMTCTGCESTITACLSGLPGVVKVGKVSYKDGTAFVLVDPKKVQNESMVKAVSDKGYTAEIIPAVSITPIGTQLTGDAKQPCGAAAAAACAQKCAKPCGAAATKTAATEKTEKTEKTNK